MPTDMSKAVVDAGTDSDPVDDATKAKPGDTDPVPPVTPKKKNRRIDTKNKPPAQGV
jgi:hypothetical protein